MWLLFVVLDTSTVVCGFHHEKCAYCFPCDLLESLVLFKDLLQGLLMKLTTVLYGSNSNTFVFESHVNTITFGHIMHSFLYD